MYPSYVLQMCQPGYFWKCVYYSRRVLYSKLGQLINHRILLGSNWSFRVKGKKSCQFCLGSFHLGSFVHLSCKGSAKNQWEEYYSEVIHHMGWIEISITRGQQKLVWHTYSRLRSNARIGQYWQWVTVTSMTQKELKEYARWPRIRENGHIQSHKII